MNRRWLYGAIGLIPVIIVALFLYARQPITTETDRLADPTGSTVQRDHDDSGQTKLSPAEARITVSDQEIDKIFEEAIAFLDRLASGEAEAQEYGDIREETIETEMIRVEGPMSESTESLSDGMAESMDEESVKPELVIDEFVAALRNLDLDTMLSMARGQAREKIEQLRFDELPPEAEMMFQQIQPTNGRLVSENEFRFNLAMPMGDQSPEIVMHRDGGRWWIDEIID